MSDLPTAAEMEEIAQFQADDPAAREMYLGIARFYQQIAAAFEASTPGDAIAQLTDFCAERGEGKRADLSLALHSSPASR